MLSRKKYFCIMYVCFFCGAIGIIITVLGFSNPNLFPKKTGVAIGSLIWACTLGIGFAFFFRRKLYFQSTQ